MSDSIKSIATHEQRFSIEAVSGAVLDLSDELKKALTTHD